MRDHFQVPIKFSQNFITNNSVISKVVGLAKITKDSLVIEFGGGEGAITRELAKFAGKVITIEKDPEVFVRLKENLKEYKNVIVLNEEILDYKLPVSDEYIVFSNIPFSITSEIINKLTFASNPPINSYIFLQKEVGEKLMGFPESQSSITIRAFFTVDQIYTFEKKDFKPVPSVDIVLVNIQKINPKIDLKYKNSYRDFVIYGFSQWKENIKKALQRKIFSNLQLKFLSKKFDFSLDAKPSELTLDQWIMLFNSFIEIVPEYKRKLIKFNTQQFENNFQGMRRRNMEISFGDKESDLEEEINPIGFNRDRNDDRRMSSDMRDNTKRNLSFDRNDRYIDKRDDESRSANRSRPFNTIDNNRYSNNEQRSFNSENRNRYSNKQPEEGDRSSYSRPMSLESRDNNSERRPNLYNASRDNNKNYNSSSSGYNPGFKSGYKGERYGSTGERNLDQRPASFNSDKLNPYKSSSISRGKSEDNRSQYRSKPSRFGARDIKSKYELSEKSHSVNREAEKRRDSMNGENEKFSKGSNYHGNKFRSNTSFIKRDFNSKEYKSKDSKSNEFGSKDFKPKDGKFHKVRNEIRYQKKTPYSKGSRSSKGTFNKAGRKSFNPKFKK